MMSWAPWIAKGLLGTAITVSVLGGIAAGTDWGAHPVTTEGNLESRLLSRKINDVLAEKEGNNIDSWGAIRLIQDPAEEGMDLSREQATRVTIDLPARKDGAVPPATVKCEIGADASILAGIIHRYYTYHGEEMPPEFEGCIYHGAGVKMLFGVNMPPNPPCPGVLFHRGDDQVQQSLYRVAFEPDDLLADLGAKSRSILEIDRAGGADATDGLTPCDREEGARASNCYWSTGGHTVYCGRIRDRARVHMGDGTTRALRPLDLALSLYWLMAYAANHDPREVVPNQCGAPSATILLYAASIQEVITSETVDDFVEALKGSQKNSTPHVYDQHNLNTNKLAERPPEYLNRMAAWISGQIKADKDRSVCFYLSLRTNDTTAANVNESANANEAHALNQEQVDWLTHSLSYPVFGYQVKWRDQAVVTPLLEKFARSLRTIDRSSEGDRVRAWTQTFDGIFQSDDLPALSPNERVLAQVQGALGKTPTIKEVTTGHQRAPDVEALFRLFGFTGDYRVDKYRNGMMNLSSSITTNSSVQVREIPPDVVISNAEACARNGQECMFYNSWQEVDVGLLDKMPRDGEDYYNMLGLFSRAGDHDVACNQAFLYHLSQRLREMGNYEVVSDFYVQAGLIPPTSLDTDKERAFGLLPNRAGRIKAPRVSAPRTQESCSITLAYNEAEPFEGSAKSIQALMTGWTSEAGVTFTVETLAVPNATIYRQARNPEGGAGAAGATWSILLATTGPYSPTRVPTLRMLVDKHSWNNRSMGSILVGDLKNQDGTRWSEATCSFFNYEYLVVDPPPLWARNTRKRCEKVFSKSQRSWYWKKDEKGLALPSFEKTVFSGPAPILPLVFLDAPMYQVSDGGPSS